MNICNQKQPLFIPEVPVTLIAEYYRIKDWITEYNL